MRVTCSICKQVIQFNNVSAAPCGHILHSDCWSRWLPRMHNCPDCRQTTLKHQLVKLVFNITEVEDYISLKTRIASLKKMNSELKSELSRTTAALVYADEKIRLQSDEIKALRQQESEQMQLRQSSGKLELAMKEDGNLKKKREELKSSKGTGNCDRQFNQVPGRYPGPNPFSYPLYQYRNISPYSARIGLPGGNPPSYRYPYPAAVNYRVGAPPRPTLAEPLRTSSSSSLQLNEQFTQNRLTETTKTIGTAPAVTTRPGLPTGTFRRSAPHPNPGAFRDIVESVMIYPAFWTAFLQPTSSVQLNEQHSENNSTETMNTGGTAPAVPAPAVPAPAVPAPAVPAPAVPAPAVPASAVPASAVPAPAVPAPCGVSTGTSDAAPHPHPSAAETVTDPPNVPPWTETLTSLLQSNDQYFLQKNSAETNYRSNGTAPAVPARSGVPIATSFPPMSPSQPLLPGVSGDPVTGTVSSSTLPDQDMDSELSSN